MLLVPDCQLEKKHIHNLVIPSLYHYCQRLGLQFHAVDFFSTVPRDISNTQQSQSSNPDDLSVCSDSMLYELERYGALKVISKEIELCQTISAGPSFVVSRSATYTHEYRYCLPYQHSVTEGGPHPINPHLDLPLPICFPTIYSMYKIMSQCCVNVHN